VTIFLNPTLFSSGISSGTFWQSYFGLTDQKSARRYLGENSGSFLGFSETTVEIASVFIVTFTGSTC
jgi:hypothetical protein